MARYIDADALLKNINTNPAEALNERCAQILEAILYAPTADVAPRAEVAREIFEEIRKIGLVTRVISSGNIIYDVTAEYTALQKKYTEEN